MVFIIFIKMDEIRTDGFMPFLRLLVQNKMKTALSRILTWFANSISFKDNCNAKDVSFVWF